MSNNVVITSAARTPMGSLQGCFSQLAAYELGAIAIKAVLERSKLSADAIDEVLMGCVLPAGQGQAPARQAALGAGLSLSCGATTINKMCGSGMKAIMLASDEITAGSFNTIIAGGMENMTLAPYLLPNARRGYRLGHHKVIDHMFVDGLEDAYDRGKLMGVFAEQCATHYHFTREQQDAFAIESLKRAQLAAKEGYFTDEIVAATVKQRKKSVTIDQDETPQKANAEKIPLLKPAFAKDGTVTAANASSISDGAAAVCLMSGDQAKASDLAPLATLRAHASFAHEPAWFTTAPVGAIKKCLERTGWSVDDVDLFEINEAFAVVTMAAMQDLKIPHNKVNIHGGACALGHPIGASGARILVTLIYALKRLGLKRGIAALCIGGGEATAMAIELE